MAAKKSDGLAASIGRRVSSRRSLEGAADESTVGRGGSEEDEDVEVRVPADICAGN